MYGDLKLHRKKLKILLVAPVTSPLAANVASMGVGYVAGQYNGAASALVSYNNRHKHNQIYLDMNRTFQYSLHILR